MINRYFIMRHKQKVIVKLLFFFFLFVLSESRVGGWGKEEKKMGKILS